MFGLQNKSEISILYDIISSKIIDANGFDLSEVNISISETKVFQIPSHLIVNGEPLFPTKYEILNSGNVLYCSPKVPAVRLYIEDDNFLNYRSKVKRYTVTPNELSSLSKESRKRYPSQNHIMGESASDHANRLVEKGILKIKNEVNVSWHWCHLIAFSLIPSKSAQKKDNLICGTSACNGHMINIETAIKSFVNKYERPLGLDVRVEYYKNSHLARRIRYRIFDKKGYKMSHSEYFDTLTDINSDVSEYKPIYNRMKNTFTN